MDHVTYVYEMDKGAVAEEVDRWIQEREIPESDAASIDLPKLVDLNLRAFAIRAKMKAQEWQDEIAAIGD